MIRLLLLILAVYIAYRVVKSLLSPAKDIRKGPEGGVIDEMVEDPFCKVYIPKREAIRMVIGGQEVFFCSNECADKYQAKRNS